MAADNWRASYQTDGGNDLLRQRRAQDQKMMADMLKMINAATPQTMLGYGLGKLLRGAWDHRKKILKLIHLMGLSPLVVSTRARQQLMKGKRYTVLPRKKDCLELILE